MTRMTGPDCVVMCNLINTHTHTHTTPDRNGDGNEGNIGDRSGNNEDGNRDGFGDEKGSGNVKGSRGGGEELWYPPYQEISRVQEQELPFRVRHHLCRQKMVLTDSQQLLA